MRVGHPYEPTQTILKSLIYMVSVPVSTFSNESKDPLTKDRLVFLEEALSSCFIKLVAIRLSSETFTQSFLCYQVITRDYPSHCKRSCTGC